MNTIKSDHKKEAIDGLQAIEEINTNVAASYNGPVWFNILLIITLSSLFFANSMENINEFWNDMSGYILLFLFGLCFIRYLVLKKRGIKLRVFPNTSRGKWIFWAVILFTVIAMQGGQSLVDAGYTNASYAVALLSAIVFGTLQYKYPSADFVDAKTK
ncbi:hypothetical protein [Glaciecola petra]|uniref:Uncharacterized protein n=1 Tax=Glaciecola petra TaxID=3075602 RepID=A0ABU2ZUY3_9ALTE|nr:hypothetical protein [Aestuariibacter sp. P117]MDT0595853.1 hypothetical protein [Aestuariibacter sp. P117]